MTNPFNKPAPPANLPSFGNDFGGDPLDSMIERETASRGKGGSFTPWTPELRIDDSGPVTLVFHDTRDHYINKILDQDGRVVEVKANNVIYIDHFSRITNKPSRCSAIPYSLANSSEAKDAAKKLCTGCMCWAQGWTQDADRKYKHDGKVSKRVCHGFSVLALDHVIDVPGTTKKNDGSYYTNQKLKGQVDRATWQRYGQGAKFGLRMALSLPRNGHYDQMFGKGKCKEDASILYKVGQNCIGCGTPNSLENRGWVCGNCQNPLDELMEGSTRGEVREWLERGGRCRACNARSPVETLFCSNPGCKAPQRAQLFNSVITLRGMPVPGGDPSKKPAVVLSLDGWRPFRREDWASKVASPDMFEPLDLVKILSGTSAERQQKVFGMLAPGLTLPGNMTAATEEYAPPQVDDSDTPFLWARSSGEYRRRQWSL